MYIKKGRKKSIFIFYLSFSFYFIFFSYIVCLFVTLIVTIDCYAALLRLKLNYLFLFIVFTAERRLIQTSAVTQLKDTRLGIDGNYWLRKVVAKENAVAAMGGLPLRLEATITKELEGFK